MFLLFAHPITAVFQRLSLEDIGHRGGAGDNLHRNAGRCPGSKLRVLTAMAIADWYSTIPVDFSGWCRNEKRTRRSLFQSLTELKIALQRYVWSGKRDSNSRPRPWQGRALPTELFPRFGVGHSIGFEECVNPLIQKVLFIWLRWSLSAAMRLVSSEPSTIVSTPPRSSVMHIQPTPKG